MKKSLLVASLAVLGFAGPAAADISVNVGAIGVMPNDDSGSLRLLKVLRE